MWRLSALFPTFELSIFQKYVKYAIVKVKQSEQFSLLQFSILTKNKATRPKPKPKPKPNLSRRLLRSFWQKKKKGKGKSEEGGGGE